MNAKFLTCAAPLVLSVMLSGAAFAQPQAGPPVEAAKEAREPLPVPAPKSFVTKHEVTIRGQRIRYTATAGETYLSNMRGKPVGSIFSFSYVKDGPADPNRPVMFVFNGGPGSSSIWLHMGIVGPKRVVLDREVNPSNLPPFGLRDNPYSALDVADLVFIDPIGTGFSQAIGEGRNEDFYSVDDDADSVAQFIELWLTKNNRWASPKFVMGESYGSIRASVLPRALMGGVNYAGVMRGITLNGVILLGTTIGGPPGSRELPRGYDGPEMNTALSLPALAATAWYHNKIDRKGQSLEAFDKEVTDFATKDYFAALKKGDALPEAERTRILTQLSAYTGLPAEAFPKDLKIQLLPMANKLLADKGLNVGAYDSRYTLPSSKSMGDAVADDPAMGLYVPGFVAAFHTLMSRDLKIEMGRPYYSINWKDLAFKWNYKRAGTPPGAAYADELVTGMRRTPGMKVLVASGYYDLVTTPAAARYQLEKADPPKDRVQFKAYESGHMLYLGETAEAFANDVRGLIASASK